MAVLTRVTFAVPKRLRKAVLNILDRTVQPEMSRVIPLIASIGTPRSG